jgi:uncharacterized repeat protein (TIGR01451 family)
MHEDRDPIAPGALLTYTLVFGNRSTQNESVSGAVLSATIPQGTAVVSASHGGDFANGVVSWPLGTINAGASGRRQFTVAVAGNVAPGTVVISEAEIVAAGLPETSARAVETTAVRVANALRLDKSVSVEKALPAELLTYTLTVTNQGTSSIIGVVLTDQVPTGVESFSATDGGTCPGLCNPSDLITWDLGTLLPGQSVTKMVPMTVAAGTVGGAILVNNAQVVGAGAAFAALAEAHVRICSAGGAPCDHVEPSRFGDVPPGHIFFRFIEALAEAGITGGCNVSPPLYCPDASVTRGQMAVFLIRGLAYPAAAAPPEPTGTVFSDVPLSHFFASWIEGLAAAGITGGCGAAPPRYCPEASVTRGQMAVFLLRARHGAGYQPPEATGMFADVPTDHTFARWIEQLAREGITGGCGTNPARYCPDSPVTRGQMAVFLVRTFGLPM